MLSCLWASKTYSCFLYYYEDIGWDQLIYHRIYSFKNPDWFSCGTKNTSFTFTSLFFLQTKHFLFPLSFLFYGCMPGLSFQTRLAWKSIAKHIYNSSLTFEILVWIIYLTMPYTYLPTSVSKLKENNLRTKYYFTHLPLRNYKLITNSNLHSK